MGAPEGRRCRNPEVLVLLFLAPTLPLGELFTEERKLKEGKENQ